MIDHTKKSGRFVLWVLKKSYEIFQGDKIITHLFRYNTIRKTVFKDHSSQVDNIQRAIAHANMNGSEGAVFPQSVEALLPENFLDHYEGSKDIWWLWFKENIPVKNAQGLSLLDIGSGPGFIGHHFLCYGYDVTALSSNDLELAECKRRGMKILKSEMHSVPVGGESYDAVLASHVLEHSVAPFVLLLEILRVLKPGGYLYVNLPYPIDGNLANDYPECYDRDSDTYSIEGNELNYAKVEEQAYYTYGFEHHFFVLTYWQWRWLFRHLGLIHIASCIQSVRDGKLYSGDEVNKDNALPNNAKLQYFILQKPAE